MLMKNSKKDIQLPRDKLVCCSNHYTTQLRELLGTYILPRMATWDDYWHNYSGNQYWSYFGPWNIWYSSVADDHLCCFCLGKLDIFFLYSLSFLFPKYLYLNLYIITITTYYNLISHVNTRQPKNLLT